MSEEIKRLAIIATCCFFPTALLGFFFYKNNEAKAVFLFRLSIYVFLFLLSVAGVYIVKEGGGVIPPMGSFF